MEKKEIIIGCFIVLIIFALSLKSSFSGYMILFFLFGGALLFFYAEYILGVLKQGGSIKFAIIASIVGAIIASMVYGAVFMYQNKQEINRNWASYKCKPYVMPVAGILVGPADTSPTATFKDCMWNINKTFFDILISPYVNMLGVITGILSGFSDDIQNVRKMTTYLRDNMEELARDVYQKIYDAYSRIAFLFKTFLRLFSKLFEVFRDLFDVMLYAFYSVASIWNGPIGGVASFFCFAENTPIRVIKSGVGSVVKPIRDVAIGDVIDDPFKSRVNGVMRFSGSGVPMYWYGAGAGDSIAVSGNHIVYEGGRWIRVSGSSLATLIQNNVSSKDIYCLATDTSLIKVGNTMFCDYFETANRETNVRIQEMILTHLNRSGGDTPCKNLDTRFGFADGATLIRMANGGNKPVAEIAIGDEVARGGRVLGKIQMSLGSGGGGAIYNYRGVALTGSVLVREGNQWRPVAEAGANMVSSTGAKMIYHLATEKHLLQTGNITLTDFLQTSDKNICSQIDNFVLQTLNKN